MMLLTIKYKNGFEKTEIVTLVQTAKGRLIYQTEDNILDVDLNYLESFKLTYGGNDNG